MNKINVNLEYCHGINKMNYAFDFTEKNNLIYAPNGTMKTSLFNTFREYKDNIETKDVFFPERISKREISDECNNLIDSDNILVVGNGESINSEDNITALLVNYELKKRYDSIFNSLSKIVKEINKTLKVLSGEKIDTILNDLQISNLFNISETYFDNSDIISEFKDIKYKDFFNKDYIECLNNPEVISSVSEYIKICNEIVEEHSIFIKNIFELHNLKAIKKNLDSNHFFDADHLLKLKINRNDNIFEDYDSNQINELINQISAVIDSDARISSVNNVLTGKIKSQELNIFLSDNKWIIPYLNDIDLLRKKYWKYIISSSEELKSQIKQYIDLYKLNEEELKEIIELSLSPDNFNNWSNAIKIFNGKFINMPFELDIKNKSEIILKSDVCSLIYKYHDRDETNENVNKDLLKNNLSRGENNAFSILNLIFEIQNRIINQKETLIILDDIADSFDYKNKYAIVEFIKELCDNPLFHVLILTHNFDFYRLCANQINVNTLSVIKGEEIRIVKFFYKRKVFKTFKENIDDKKYFISCIPFVRNIIELTDGIENEDYLLLTNSLHYKEITSNITVSMINNIYDNIIKKSSNLVNDNYIDLLFNTADEINLNENKICLENKLILSIAIRLRFEKYMISKIGSWETVNSIENINENQTYRLIKYCKDNNLFNDNDSIISDKVRIMTSENIHVNAFMYEPIIDMSDEELINLYNDVKNLE